MNEGVGLAEEVGVAELDGLEDVEMAEEVIVELVGVGDDVGAVVEDVDDPNLYRDNL